MLARCAFCTTVVFFSNLRFPPNLFSNKQKSTVTIKATMAPVQQQQLFDSSSQKHSIERDGYLDAQRAANESIEIGRAALAQVSQQQEQLEHASHVADETNYTLEKASRALRAMTWSGWVANKFSKEPTASELTTKRSAPPLVYENLPSVCQAATQAIQNYHANLNILETCIEREQKATLDEVCQDMYRVARQKVHSLPEAYRLDLQQDLETLRSRHQAATNVSSKDGDSATEAIEKKNLFGTPKQNAKMEPSPLHQEQESHLSTLSASLGEQLQLAQNLQQSLATQSEVLNRLDGKSETILNQSEMVTRRADRLIQSKSWAPTKATLDRVVHIRHEATGTYLAISNNKVVLATKFQEDMCTFGIWKRQGQLFGIKHKSGTWLGQSLLGSLGVQSSFGQRQEWQALESDNHTKLLCASAGWGAGGYLRVKNDTAYISGGTVEERNRADWWCLVETDG